MMATSLDVLWFSFYLFCIDEIRYKLDRMIQLKTTSSSFIHLNQNSRFDQTHLNVLKHNQKKKHNLFPQMFNTVIDFVLFLVFFFFFNSL